MAGGHGGGGGHHPGYPVEVWSPAGGWFCDPRRWRRNTAVALLAIAAVAAPIAMASAAAEQRPLAPIRPLPSQLWCKNFPKKADAQDASE
eukprot:SM000076S21755  [mRNA]  locus=s76:122319:122807:+ [translate_table: standard]